MMDSENLEAQTGLVNSSAKIGLEPGAPDVDSVLGYLDHVQAFDLGAGVQIEVPRLAAVGGAVYAADAGVQVAADGEAEVFAQKFKGANREGRLEKATA